MARFTQPVDTSGSGTPGPAGPQGPQGPAGADGVDALWNFVGEYNNGADYSIGDVVTYAGGTYYRVGEPNPGYAPGTSYWTTIAEPGVDGADGTNGTNGADFGIYYLGNYISTNGYIADIAVVRGSDGQLYLAKANGQLGDPINYQSNGQWEVWIPKGADGSDGADGADGTSLIWSAEFDPGTTYPLNYVVSYQGSSYIKIANESVGDFPLPTNNTYWNLVAQKGDQGDPGISGTTAVLAHSVKAGEALTKGQAVYVSSADGTNMIVSKASNTLESTSSKTMGLITTSLANNGQGTLLTEGLLAGLNTATANAGDPVWLGTDGNLIYGLANKPSAPAHLVFIGIVTRSNANNGEIFVKCQNGFEVRELHDAVIESNGSVTDNEVFAYDSASGMWKNQTATEALLTPLRDGLTESTAVLFPSDLVRAGNSSSGNYWLMGKSGVAKQVYCLYENGMFWARVMNVPRGTTLNQNYYTTTVGSDFTLSNTAFFNLRTDTFGNTTGEDLHVMMRVVGGTFTGAVATTPGLSCTFKHKGMPLAHGLNGSSTATTYSSPTGSIAHYRNNTSVGTAIDNVRIQGPGTHWLLVGSGEGNIDWNITGWIIHNNGTSGSKVADQFYGPVGTSATLLSGNTTWSRAELYISI